MPPKRPAAPASDSEDNGAWEDQQVILQQLVALEKAQGLSPGSAALPGHVRGRSGAGGCLTAMKQFQAQLRSHLLCVTQSQGLSTEEAPVPSPEQILQEDVTRLVEGPSCVSPAVGPVPQLAGNGEYPLTPPLGIVWPWGPGGPAAAFVPPAATPSMSTGLGGTPLSLGGE